MNNLHILQHKMLERRYASDWESQLLMNETGKCSTRQLLILLTTNCTNIFCSPGWIPNVTFSLQLNYLNSSKLIEENTKLQHSNQTRLYKMLNVIEFSFGLIKLWKLSKCPSQDNNLILLDFSNCFTPRDRYIHGEVFMRNYRALVTVIFWTFL